MTAMTSYREWTIGDLAQMLSHLPQEDKVRLLDADTSWTIHLFDVIYEAEQHELWFYPSDYSEIGKL